MRIAPVRVYVARRSAIQSSPHHRRKPKSAMQQTSDARRRIVVRTKSYLTPQFSQKDTATINVEICAEI